MGIAADGMKITEYMENGRQEYLWVHYKAADDLSGGEYRELFQGLKEEGVLVNDSYADAEWVLKGGDGRKFHVRFCFGAGISPKTVQAYMGHAFLQMTMDLYNHVTEAFRQDEIGKLEREEK